MRTIGFSGKSGTGKSFKALLVASDNNIRLIVDDGLLICDGKVLAGKSAKKEKNKYASVLRAIFNDDEHAGQVRDAIEKTGEDSILILGTSEKMVNLIADKLGVFPVDKHIHIEDVSTPKEIKIANNMRTRYGKHVIPVPALEIKRTFSGYLLDPITSIKKLADGLFDKTSSERTIIRPTYGYLGDFEITEKVLCQIARYEASKVDGVASVDKVVFYQSSLKNEFRIDVTLKYGSDFKTICSSVQERIIESVDHMTAIYLDSVDVCVVKVDMEK